MTYISEKATGLAARKVGRLQPQKFKHIQVRHSTKRVLQEQAAANVEDGFDVCCDRGFYFDPDINIGSDADLSRELSSMASN